MGVSNNRLLLSILALDSYNQGYNKGIDHGQTTIGSANFSIDKGDQEAQDTGFYAVSYTIGTGELAETVISYRGTDNQSFNPFDTTSDIYNGWITGAGAWKTDQVRFAAEFFQTVTGTQTGDPRTGNATLTGHSLGGGLAGKTPQTCQRPRNIVSK